MKFDRQPKLLILIAILTIVLAANAVSHLLFSSLGKTSTNNGWSYVLTLYIFLAAIGTIFYLSTTYRTLANFCQTLSTLLCGALIGFYYGGILTANNPIAALGGGIIASILFALWRWLNLRFLLVIVAFIAGFAAYGFAFYLGTQGLALLNVSRVLPGISWLVFSILYQAIAIKNLTVGIIQFRKNVWE